MQVSVRELKTNPSYYIRQAEAGEAVWITSHKHIVARLVAVTDTKVSAVLGDVSGVQWSGKKPRGGRSRPVITGKSLADTVLEMR